MSLPMPATSSETAPDSPTPAPPLPPLTFRQEAFCRHYAATGNAAGAARAAGYAEGSARQTGHDLLERPDIAARVRDIRQAWRAVEREEAQILLGRLEQAWDVAVEKGSATLMLRVVRLSCRPSCPASTGATPGGAPACGPCPKRMLSPTRRTRTLRNPARPPVRPLAPWPKRFAGAATGPNGRSLSTGRAGKPWSNARNSTRRTGWRPPTGCTAPSKNAGRRCTGPDRPKTVRRTPRS